MLVFKEILFLYHVRLSNHGTLRHIQFNNFTIFEKSQIAVNRPIDDLIKLNRVAIDTDQSVETHYILTIDTDAGI